MPGTDENDHNEIRADTNFYPSPFVNFILPLSNAMAFKINLRLRPP